jgi:hypothetical protein
VKVKLLLVPTLNVRIPETSTDLVATRRRIDRPNTLLANVTLARVRLDRMGGASGRVGRVEGDRIRTAATPGVPILEDKLGLATGRDSLTLLKAGGESLDFGRDTVKAVKVTALRLVLLAGMTDSTRRLDATTARQIKRHANVVVAITVAESAVVHLVRRELNTLRLFRTGFNGTGKRGSSHGGNGGGPQGHGRERKLHDETENL